LNLIGNSVVPGGALGAIIGELTTVFTRIGAILAFHIGKIRDGDVNGAIGKTLHNIVYVVCDGYVGELIKCRQTRQASRVCHNTVRARRYAFQA
jgi:hypothetical protein